MRKIGARHSDPGPDASPETARSEKSKMAGTNFARIILLNRNIRTYVPVPAHPRIRIGVCS